MPPPPLLTRPFSTIAASTPSAAAISRIATTATLTSGSRGFKNKTSGGQGLALPRRPALPEWKKKMRKSSTYGRATTWGAWPLRFASGRTSSTGSRRNPAPS
uniref:Uncharacterized protein n=1 Tax=Triticum urartu TaxID=4572 RepID=A0A8R7QD48_TRIUA